MQVVDDVLDRVGLGAGRGGQREDAKVRIGRHEVADDGAVGVVAGRAMGLVDDDADDVGRLDAPGLEIVADRLRRGVEDAPGPPRLGPRVGRVVARQLDRVRLRDPDDRRARLDLLGDERPRRRHEDDLPAAALGVRVPAVEVEHHDRRDERLAEARRQRAEHVGEQRLVRDVVLADQPRPSCA